YDRGARIRWRCASRDARLPLHLRLSDGALLDRRSTSLVEPQASRRGSFRRSAIRTVCGAAARFRALVVGRAHRHRCLAVDEPPRLEGWVHGAIGSTGGVELGVFGCQHVWVAEPRPAAPDPAAEWAL